MLKSLILLLLSVMIFTSCGDNGVEEEIITSTTFRFDRNYYVPYTSPNNELIEKIKNKTVNIKLKDINNQEYFAVQIIEYKTNYQDNIITYKIQPQIILNNNNEIIDIVVTAIFKNENIKSSKLDNEIYQPLIKNIREIILN